MALAQQTLTLADATLRRGTRFLGTGLADYRGDPCARRHGGRARMIGNGLRELDRFLSLLIDAAAAFLPLSPPDRAALARGHNTARKLAIVRSRLALANPDDAALRSIGRMRDCLFHTAGIVRANRAGSAPTTGWAHPDAVRGGIAPARLAIGLRIDVTTADLHRICRFYDRIADDLIDALDQQPAQIDCCPDLRYIKTAHVACDGI